MGSCSSATRVRGVRRGGGGVASPSATQDRYNTLMDSNLAVLKTEKCPEIQEGRVRPTRPGWRNDPPPQFPLPAPRCLLVNRIPNDSPYVFKYVPPSWGQAEGIKMEETKVK